jgi:uncharacterized protein (DUF58 family)
MESKPPDLPAAPAPDPPTRAGEPAVSGASALVEERAARKYWRPPLPRPLALLLTLVAALSTLAGFKQGELVTILLGAVLSVVLAYTFAASLILALIHRRRAGRLSLRMAPEAAASGRPGTLLLNRDGAEGKFFRLPGILVRCETVLRTADNRRLELVFDPDRLDHHTFPFTVPLRGAYSGQEDRFLVMDILGLFRAATGLPSEAGARLLSMPEAAETPLLLETGGGGDDQRAGTTWTRTDNFIDHRPYTPGDDPRRINWKLYGHSGDLFIREGEREPPPHSRLMVLIDTQYDPRLYSPEAGSRGVDLLCENALALIAEYQRRGMDLSLGYTGGSVRAAGTLAEYAALLAYPAARSLKEAGDLPAAGGAKRVLALALPREDGRPGSVRTERGSAETGLDRFLRGRGRELATDLVFFWNGEHLAEAADTCAAHYAKKPGVRALSAGL